ncbi:Serine/threonine protein kinase [Ectocarpus siliculosus]|uniref:non-specific serine/threonine protein kinase n=1 Tax=Ectocarpus siliculosus TaxID=2880 RepID=D8LSU7_ECTSI|nr:Serine/threonine protein kinase [Ectocarpus siliculosus]|eukprot:CBN77874.1 Serine/threonine protein kinase [Ectocarpus siliculosus]
MTEVYRALIHLGCDWRVISSYKIHCRWKPNTPTPPNKAPFLSVSTSCPSLKDKLSAASASPSGLLVNGGGGVNPFTALLERVPEVVDSACSTPALASPTSSVRGAAAARRAGGGGGGGVTGDSKQQPLEQRGDGGRGDGSPSELCGGGGGGSVSNGPAATGESDGDRAAPGSTEASLETAAAGGGGGGGGGGDGEDATAIAAPAAVGGDGDEDDDAMDGNENQDPRAAANKAASLGRAAAEDGVAAAPTTTVRAKSPRTRQAAAAAAAERQCQARPPPRHGAAAGARCEEGWGGNRGDGDVDGDVSMPSGPAVLSFTPAFSPGVDRTNSSSTAKGVAAGGGWKAASPTDAPATTSPPSPASGDGRRNGGPWRSGLRAGGGGSALAGGARATEKSCGGGGVFATAATAASSAPGSLGGATSNPFLKPDFVIKVCLTLYKVQNQIYLLDFQKLEGDPFGFMSLCSQVINQLKMLSAQSKQMSTAALERSRPSHRRSASESSGGARGRPGRGGGGGGSPSAGRKHAAHSLMTLAQLHKRAAVSKIVPGPGGSSAVPSAAPPARQEEGANAGLEGMDTST